MKEKKPFSSPTTSSLSWHIVEPLMVVWCFTSARLTGMEGVLLGMGSALVKSCGEICLKSGQTPPALESDKIP